MYDLCKSLVKEPLVRIYYSWSLEIINYDLQYCQFCYSLPVSTLLLLVYKNVASLQVESGLKSMADKKTLKAKGMNLRISN